jgi:hypothetical protein
MIIEGVKFADKKTKSIKANTKADIEKMKNPIKEDNV